jgi:hypothetical protein
VVQGWGRHNASFHSGANTITRTSRTSNGWQSEVSQSPHNCPPIRSIEERVSKPEQTRILCVPDPTHSRPACKLSSASRALFCTATNNGGVQYDPQSIRSPQACTRKNPMPDRSKQDLKSRLSFVSHTFPKRQGRENDAAPSTCGPHQTLK